MKKIFSIIGMAVSCVLIILGIMVAMGEMGGANSYASISYKSAETSPYDSGWAKFGSDFYTYSNNNAYDAAVAARAASANAYEAAEAAAAASTNIRELSDLMEMVFGIMLMAMGAFGFLGFGVVFAGTNEPRFAYSAPAVPSYAPPAQPVPQEPAYKEPEKPFDYRHQSSAQNNFFTDLPDQN